MPQIFQAELLAPLVRGSNTTVTFASTYFGQQVRVTVAGQQFTHSGLTLSTATSGLNGLDTGGVAASSTYFVYAVVTSAGALGLVASLSAAGPAVHASYVGNLNNGGYKFVGNFTTDATPVIVGAFPIAVSARGIIGDTSGTAVPANYIGQIISGTLTSSISLTASLADVTALTVTLTQGVWLLTVALQFQCFNGQAVAWLVSGASTPVAAMGTFANAATEFMAAQSMVVPINISATTTYKIQAYRTGSQAIIYGDTIAYPGMTTGQSKLVAVRIA